MNHKFRLILITFIVICSSLFVAATAQAYEGKIIDAQTNAPIAGAVVIVNDDFVRTGKDGTFKLDGTADTLKIRAPGYAKQEIPTSSLSSTIALKPFKVKALYLSSYG